MYYSFIYKNDRIMKRVIVLSTRLLRLTFNFVVGKIKFKIILSKDGLTIDLSERNRKRSNDGLRA